jgi:predicted nuclease of predicted toxin-antitoxin system
VKFKLDENLSRRAVEPLKQAGHDILTVTDENLAGADDATVLTIARDESRCLITLDLEFANPLLFNPSEYKGIVVVRLPPRPSLQDVVQGTETLVRAVAGAQLEGKLWSVACA